MDSSFFTLKEAAEYFKKSESTVLGWYCGRGPQNFRSYCSKLGATIIITHENLHRFLNNLSPLCRAEGGQII